MTKLVYPKPPYVKLGMWTIKAKIHYYTGIPFEQIHIWGSGESLYINFQVDLTQEQIDWINNLMIRPDLQGPDTDLILAGNSYVVYDFWERREMIATAAGFDFRIWYDASGVLGPNVMDKIIFTPYDSATGGQKILTNTDKKNFVNALEDGNGWE